MSARRHPLARRLLLCAALALVLAVGLAGWTAWQVLQGGRELQAAADELEAAVDDLEDQPQALRRVDAAVTSAAAAREHLTDPVVRAVGTLPLVGRPVDLASALARSTDTALTGAVRPLLEAAGPDPVASLLPGGGRIDLATAARLAAPAGTAATALRLAEDELLARPEPTGIDRLDEAQAELTSRLSDLSDAVDALALSTALAPELLDGEAPRRYLVVPQNTAESRGTGGLVGGYLLLEAQDGSLRVVQSGTNSDLRRADAPVVDLGTEFADHWVQGTEALQRWNNANLSPHFPYAAEIWSALWQQQTGQELDGVVALDPTALSYLLEATGPVTAVDGTRVDAGNVVQVTQVDAYARFGEDNEARNDFLQDVSRRTADALLDGDVSPRKLVNALSRAAEERRLLLWLRDTGLRGALLDRAISGRMPDRPAVGVVVNNAAASKLDVYLERELVWQPPCGGRDGSLTVRLRNTAPATGLPEYVSLDLYRDGAPIGTNELIVTLYVPPTVEPGQLTRDGGDPGPLRTGTERGQRYVDGFVRLEPGQSTELVLPVSGDAPPDLAVVGQPLVRPLVASLGGC